MVCAVVSVEWKLYCVTFIWKTWTNSFQIRLPLYTIETMSSWSASEFTHVTYMSEGNSKAASSTKIPMYHGPRLLTTASLELSAQLADGLAHKSLFFPRNWFCFQNFGEGSYESSKFWEHRKPFKLYLFPGFRATLLPRRNISISKKELHNTL